MTDIWLGPSIDSVFTSDPHSDVYLVPAGPFTLTNGGGTTVSKSGRTTASFQVSSTKLVDLSKSALVVQATSNYGSKTELVLKASALTSSQNTIASKSIRISKSSLVTALAAATAQTLKTINKSSAFVHAPILIGVRYAITFVDKIGATRLSASLAASYDRATSKTGTVRQTNVSLASKTIFIVKSSWLRETLIFTGRSTTPAGAASIQGIVGTIMVRTRVGALSTAEAAATNLDSKVSSVTSTRVPSGQPHSTDVGGKTRIV